MHERVPLPHERTHQEIEDRLDEVFGPEVLTPAAAPPSAASASGYPETVRDFREDDDDDDDDPAERVARPLAPLRRKNEKKKKKKQSVRARATKPVARAQVPILTTPANGAVGAFQDPEQPQVQSDLPDPVAHGDFPALGFMPQFTRSGRQTRPPPRFLAHVTFGIDPPSYAA